MAKEKSEARSTKKEEGREEPKTGRDLKLGTVLLWLLVSVSLLLNVLILNQLFSIRQTALQTIEETSAMIDAVQEQTFEMNFPVAETVIIDTTVPVQETVSVPINTTVPIDTVVTVNVNGGLLGEIPLRIPIQTDIPVNLTIDVPLDETVHVRAPVDFEVNVPVVIVVSETDFYATLEEIQATLDAIATDLRGSGLR